LLLQAQLSKASPLVNQRVGDVDFWSSYGVIVVGVEAKAKARLKRNQKPADTITDVVLEPGTLLIFTAREWAEVRGSCAGAWL
jgi:K+/H+ antiporter YhaU regulatory subunit KhtT